MFDNRSVTTNTCKDYQKKTGDKIFNNKEQEKRILSTAEIVVAKTLRTIFSQTAIGEYLKESPDFWETMSGFEYYIPEVLKEIHPEWEYESLDGVIPLVAQKVEEQEGRFFGLCFFFDQMIAPIYIHLQINSSEDKVNWLECRVGEKGPHGMERCLNRSFDKQLHRLEGKEDQVNWAYWLTFGEKV